MKDDDFKLLRDFADRQTNEQQIDICDCRVAFTTEKCFSRYKEISLSSLQLSQQECSVYECNQALRNHYTNLTGFTPNIAHTAFKHLVPMSFLD